MSFMIPQMIPSPVPPVPIPFPFVRLSVDWIKHFGLLIFDLYYFCRSVINI